MKRIFFILFFAAQCSLVYAQQNVGIGTATPNASAQLDVTSTTKGFLMPRMTSAQRTGIPSPVAGLMVYDTDRKLFYQYDGSIWRLMLNNDFWNRASSTSNYIVNLQDSVGIGTTGPTEKLDVNGNIRTRNNVLADATVSANSLVSAGNLIVSTTGFVNGDFTTNSDLIINNTTATLQLKSSNVNKGYFQLSGNDVRFGTNSGNSTGNLIIRMNGNNRVSINPAGDIDLDGKITRTSVTGSAPLLPVCFGQVDGSGAIISGTGNFTVDKVSDGVYHISCALFTSTSVIIATPNQLPSAFGAGYLSPGKMSVFSSSSNTYFQFVVYNAF